MSETFSRVARKPNGLLILVGIGVLGGVISVLNGITLIETMPSSQALLPAMLGVLGVAQVAVMLALLTMNSWAWYATVVVYSLSGVVEVATDDLFGALIAALIIFYVYTLREYYLD